MCPVSSRQKKRRKRKQSLNPGDPPYEHEHARMELDSHADTTALGKGCVVLQDTGRTVTVEGFDGSIGSMKNVPIVTAAVAYDCLSTFKTFVLIFHEALFVPNLEPNLINPYQLRHQGITVNDVPLSQLEPPDRNMESHSVLSKEEGLHIPLSLEGTMSGFTIRKPTTAEITDADPNKVVYVHMTSDAVWVPHDNSAAKVEQAFRDNLTRGYDFHDKEPRDIGSMQARGQGDCQHVNPEGGFVAGRNGPFQANLSASS